MSCGPRHLLPTEIFPELLFHCLGREPPARRRHHRNHRTGLLRPARRRLAHRQMPSRDYSSPYAGLRGDCPPSDCRLTPPVVDGHEHIVEVALANRLDVDGIHADKGSAGRRTRCNSAMSRSSRSEDGTRCGIEKQVTAENLSEGSLRMPFPTLLLPICHIVVVASKMADPRSAGPDEFSAPTGSRPLHQKDGLPIFRREGRPRARPHLLSRSKSLCRTAAADGKRGESLAEDGRGLGVALGPPMAINPQGHARVGMAQAASHCANVHASGDHLRR
jgi:hypothetical protein